MNLWNEDYLLTSNRNITLYLLGKKITSVDKISTQKIKLKNVIISKELILIIPVSEIGNSLKFHIIDLNGKEVINSILQDLNSSEIKIEFEKYPKGIYFFNTEINGQNYHLKFIKEF